MNQRPHHPDHNLGIILNKRQKIKSTLLKTKTKYSPAQLLIVKTSFELKTEDKEKISKLLRAAFSSLVFAIIFEKMEAYTPNSKRIFLVHDHHQTNTTPYSGTEVGMSNFWISGGKEILSTYDIDFQQVIWTSPQKFVGVVPAYWIAEPKPK